MGFSTVIAGQHLVCYVNGLAFGVVAQMQLSVDTPWRGMNVIDFSGPVELMPGQRRVTGSFGIVLARAGGSLEAMGLTAFAQDLLKQKLLTIQLVDRITGQVVFEASQVVVLNQTWQTAPKQLVVGSFAWEGMTWSNVTDQGQ